VKLRARCVSGGFLAFSDNHYRSDCKYRYWQWARRGAAMFIAKRATIALKQAREVRLDGF
jgi:hypothetical protein